MKVANYKHPEERPYGPRRNISSFDRVISKENMCIEMEKEIADVNRRAEENEAIANLMFDDGSGRGIGKRPSFLGRKIQRFQTRLNNLRKERPDNKTVANEESARKGSTESVFPRSSSSTSRLCMLFNPLTRIHAEII